MFERYQVGNKLIAQMHFPDGVVALDIDAPGDSFDQEPLRGIMVWKVRELAGGLSAKWSLGRFWLYHTGSPGMHIIFERPTANWREILDDARHRNGWRECNGHAEISQDDGYCALRVGHKESRPEWDIFPLEDNPTEDLPSHVVEHDGYLARQIPVYNGATFVCPYFEIWPERRCASCQERDVCPGKREE